MSLHKLIKLQISLYYKLKKKEDPHQRQLKERLEHDILSLRLRLLKEIYSKNIPHTQYIQSKVECLPPGNKPLS